MFQQCLLYFLIDITRQQNQVIEFNGAFSGDFSRINVKTEAASCVRYSACFNERVFLPTAHLLTGNESQGGNARQNDDKTL
ncbi:hypothetical protein [Xenorhabdus doucetiae]|uniref:hypothetical protein n=1 Tax=Xenorhabdus doucetiae TaxID=351671 RepID=UPI002B40A326|nr:hypothetical protein [Xenorhabdus sp. 18]